jgi:hypothetical protein
MRKRLLIPLFAAVLPGMAQGAQVPVGFVTSKVESQKSTLNVFPYWVSLAADLGANPFLMRGASLAVGWQLQWIGFDARVGLGSMSYSMVSVSAGPSDTDNSTAAGDPTAERSRPRNGSDPWSYFLIEPGISVIGRLFASSLPQLTERVRFGMGYGSMSDQINNLSFSAISFSFETDLEYQLGVGSRFAVKGGVIYNAGVLDNKADSDPTHGRLPASWLQEQLALVYYF